MLILSSRLCSAVVMPSWVLFHIVSVPFHFVSYTGGIPLVFGYYDVALFYTRLTISSRLCYAVVVSFHLVSVTFHFVPYTGGMPRVLSGVCLHSVSPLWPEVPLIISGTPHFYFAYLTVK